LKKERSKKYRIVQLLRIISQAFFFGLFFYLLLGTHFPGEDYIGRVEIFFHSDPLIALTTIIAARVLLASFVFAGITLLATFIFGRFFCGWFCPLGSLHQFFSFLFKKTKWLRPKILKNNHTVWKYYILIFALAASVFSLNLIGVLDPFSLLYRSFAVSVLPAAHHSFQSMIGILYNVELYSVGDTLVQFFANLDINSIFLQGFFIGGLFFLLVLLNMHRERFWCRYVCPLGAFLGIAARWNVLKLEIDKEKCIDCGLCTRHCETQANPYPNDKWKNSECIYCFTCSSICPTAAVSFPVKTKPEPVAAIDLSRRKVLFTSFLGALAVPFFRVSPAETRSSEKLIRPPGALAENEFLQKCVKCGECMKVCPTNAIQPVMFDAGPNGIWTPKLVPEIGYCEYYCSLCTQVCPTGAIQELTVEQKTQVKIGTSWINKNRCIPWTFGDPCIVCEEHCPVSPKAIKLLETEVKTPEGEIKRPLAPVIDMELCIGCGICENKCPVVDEPAIYVTSVGESRSDQNQLKLDVISGGEGIY
jgi:polyferredoxin